ncbi:unnamed protein product (macronuclear) [Paramecium tetraurelia]|uniref:RING-type domain-containing protein n=1 Tax=Paramecium tetraurelia TaxID=5888 RepID=A0BTH8_PARTE|nr:uncharacterized protein GSPATT00032077001 [Paramecium tetraurelia]CAK61845.1 unnamed protein product [Paramecium tetraurelia]|eukprot:XP_001429243.1 hypothetical protein (macronuclear) [Paramecium tetraurelia strain d4-2]
MGKIFSSPQDQNRQNVVLQKQFKEINDSSQPCVSISTHRPKQSQGETNHQDYPCSYIFQETKSQTAQQESENIQRVSLDESHEQIVIDASGRLVKSQENFNQNHICYYCNKQIEELLIKVICQHKYHHECFVKLIEQQFLQSDRHYIKCKCGTKLNPNLLRQIVDKEVRYKMLYQLFSSQLQIILKTSIIRKNPDHNQIVQLVQSNTVQQDFDYQQIVNQTEQMQIKIQEIQFKSNGMLYQSASKLLITSNCQVCQKQIDQNVIKLNCDHFYHINCFLEWMEMQITDRTKHIVKCKCGSKLSTNIIRTLPDLPKRMMLLNQLFSSQLICILKLLKKKDDFIQIMELFHRFQNTEDYDYISHTGFIYQSNTDTPDGE